MAKNDFVFFKFTPLRLLRLSSSTASTALRLYGFTSLPAILNHLVIFSARACLPVGRALTHTTLAAG